MIKISIFIVFSLKPYYVDKKLVYHLPSLVCAFSIHLCIHLYKNLSISSLKSIFNFISFYFLFFSFIYLFFFLSTRPVIAQIIITGMEHNAAHAQAAPLGLV